MFSRRELGLLMFGAAGLAAGRSLAEPSKDLVPEMGDDGLFVQPWFLNSFLVLEDDLNEANENGKRLAIFFEQKGCPYCKETHLVNLADPEINEYVRDNFEILQLNIWGSRTVTDFDGQEMEERALARKWGVIFTPTIVFVGAGTAEIKANGGKSEVVRMPGYFKPFHFLHMFKYVRENAYKKEQFQKFLQIKADELRAQGKKVKLW